MKSNGKSTTPIIAAHAKKNNGNQPAPPSREKGNGIKRVSRVSSKAMDKLKCQVLERISDGIIAFDAEMNHIYVNERAGKFLGREPQDLVGKNFLKIYPHLMGTPFVDACQRALETQSVIPFDGYFAPSDAWLQARVYPSSDGVSVILQEGKHPEELQHIAPYYIYKSSQFPEQNPNPVMRFTRDGQLLYANRASTPLLTSWIGQTRHNLPIELLELLFVVLQTGANKEIELESNGKTYSCLIVPVQESEYVNLYFSDITERKQTEESINAIIHQTITGITRADINGRFLFANQSFCEMVGYAETELLDKSIWDVNHPDDVAKNKRMFERMITEGEPFQMEKRIVRRNGSILWVTMGTSPLRDASGQIYAAVCVVVNITRRKRAEEALLDSARRTLYLASLSDAFRSLNNMSQIEAEAVRILGAHLKASRVAYATIQPDDTVTVKSYYTDGVPGLTTTFNIGAYLPGELLTKLRAGRTVTISGADPMDRSSDALEARDEPAPIHTQVVVPLLREAELVAALFVQQSQKRDWKNEEVHVMEETAQRMQTAIERMRAEEALERERELLEGIVEAMPVMLSMYDPSTTSQRLNRQFRKLIGWQKETVSPRELVELCYPDPEYRNEVIQRLSAGQPNEWVDVKMQTCDGRTLETTWSNIKFSNGTQVGLGIDISERKRAEEALRESEEKYRLIVATANEGIWEIDKDTRTVFVNRRMAEMLGYPPEEIIGHSAFEFILPEDHSDGEQRLESAKQGKRSYASEFRYRRKDGSILWTLASRAPKLDVQGNFLGSVAMLTDITERKRAREEIYRLNIGLQAQLDETQALLDMLPTGVWIGNEDCSIITGNPAAYQMMGLPSGINASVTTEELQMPAGVRLFVNGAEVPGEDAPMQMVARSGKPLSNIEHEILFANGIRKSVVANVVPLFDEKGTVRRVIGAYTDITERKRAEDQLRELSQRLTYHVDNSPLAVIEWGSDMRLSRWSGTAEQIFGWKAEEVLGKRMEDIPWVYKEDLQQVNEVSTDLQTGNNVHRFSTNRNYRKDGSVAYCEWYNSSLVDESGKLHSILSLVLDITERKQSERALVEYARQQSALYKLVDQLHRADTLTDVFDASLEAILSALQCDRASILLFDETKLMHFLAWRGLSEEYRQATDGHSPWKYGEENPTPIWYDDVNLSNLSDALKAVIAREGIGSLAFIPLVYQETLIGKFMVYYNTSHVFMESEINLALTIGRQLASAVDRKRAEEHLRTSEDRLRLAVTAGNIGIWDIDLVRRNRAWSKEGKAIYGLAEDEYLDFERQLELTHPDDRAYVDQAVRAFRDQGTIKQLNLEHRIVHPDGSVRWVEVQGEAVYEEEPAPVRLIGTIVDITERKNVEDALRESEERYRALVSQATAGIVRKDQNGKLIFVNDAFCEMLGYSASELSEKTMWQITHPEDVSENRRLYNRLMTEGIPFQLEKRLIRRDGSILWATVSVSPVLDAAGKPESAVSVYADITERKQAESRLALLIEVSDLTRKLEDPVELMAAVADAVGKHFQIKRCLFNEIDIENNREVVHRDYHDGVESVAGTHKITDYSSITTGEMIAGKTVVNFDSRTDPRTAPDYERSYVPNGERAYIAIPLTREDRWVASLWISDDKPRPWSEEEVVLLQTIAERTWTATERLRINKALRESEERLRKLNIELEERVQRRTTELQAANEFLRESEAISRLILESMPDAIIIADKEGHIVYGNTRVESLFGYTTQEVIGQPVEVLIPQRFHDKHVNHRSDYSQNPHRRYMGLDRELFGQRKDQSEFPVDVMLSPISNNTNWDVVVTIRDSTEQKQAQQALRVNEEKLRKLFQVLPIGVSFLDNQARITEMNSALTDILRLSKHELLEGKFSHRGYIRSDGSPMPPSEYASVRAHEEQKPIYNVETGIIKENGEVIWTSVNAAPVDIADVDVVVATIDITERKKAVDALHKHRERLRILSRRLVEVQEEERRAIARELHDRVGQNLAALNLNLNILRSQLTNTALLEVGQRLSDSVNLVNQILTITRNVMGDLRSDVLDDYGLEAALREYADQFTGRTGIQVVLDKAAKPIPRMDPSIEMTLLRIAQEALTNVSKHAQAKQATVLVNADHEAVYMSIQDDGIGILSWQRANQQGSHGLRIIRERAEAFGGSVQVQSTYKKGTRIDVKIPLGNLSQPKVSREKQS